MRLLAFYQRPIQTDERVGRSTTAADDVHQSFVDQFSHLRSHALCGLVVESEGIGQTGIWMTTDIPRSLTSQLTQIGFHLCGSEGAVQSYGEHWIGAYAGQEGVERLSAERSSCQVADGHREHDGQLAVTLTHHLHGCIDGTFRIQRVEDGLYEQGIHPTLHQTVHLFLVGKEQFVVGHLTHSGIAHVRRHGERLVGGTDTARHKPRFLRRAVSVGHPAGDSGTFQGHFPRTILKMIVGLRDALAAEGVGGDDVGACLEITAVDILYHLRTAQVQLVGIADLPHHSPDHRAHCTVEDEYPFFDYLVKPIHCQP